MQILLIDDNSADRELMIHSLRKSFPDAEYKEICRARELELALEHNTSDIVLTDYQLNWTNGLEILVQIKQRYPYVPVIMVTGTGNEEIAVEGLRSGLSNYILKRHLDRLPQAVRECLEKAQLQKQYEEAIEHLRVSEERYREIFEQGLTGVFVASPDGKLLACNTAFARIFGFSSVPEVIGINLKTFYSTGELYTRFIDLLQNEKRIEYYEVEMRGRDDVPVYVIENVVGTFDSAGNIKEIKGYIFDNTERKKLVDQLQQAQRLESVGLLVSGIAHDFNNMLGGILGYASRGLARVSEHHPLYENLSHIHEIATRAARMTHQLLAFSRRQVLEPTDINLNTVVENLLKFWGKLSEDRIDIQFIPDPHLKSVCADYGQIEQVILNLCVNAHDAMPDGGRLTLRTSMLSREEASRQSGRSLEEAEYALLQVQDSGHGMDEQVRMRIFEPFFTTKEVGKGTGLGLSMVHGIIGQHGGHISVESEIGKGTTFSVYLPIVDHQPHTVLSTMDGQVPQIVRGGDEVILVVEDDPDLRCLMEYALEDYGYTVMSAPDGAEGLEMFKRHHGEIALVVSDLVTPKMRGKELHDHVRTLSKETRFLFVSGYPADQISHNFMLTDGFVLLPKPFDLDDLAAKVREILG